MSKITSKILGLGGMAVVFAGMSFGQTLNCTYTAAGGEPNPILDRVEDTTALVADVLYTCTPGAGGVLSGASATITLNEPVTSKILTAATATSDAVMIINDTTTPANSSVTQGVVAGNTITFSPLMIPSGDNFTIRFANVRVNASMAPAATNFGITEGVFISDLGVSVFPVLPAPTVGIVVQGFKTPALTTTAAAGFVNPSSYVICTSNPVATATRSFQLTVGENFGGAFKTQTPTSGGTCPAGSATPCILTNGEQGSYTGTVGMGVVVANFGLNNTGGAAGTAVAGLGTATHGTRFQFAFANVPTGATVYVPVTLVNGTLTMQLTASATGAFSALATNAPASAGPNVVGLYGLTASAGSATAVYEVTKTDNTVANESVTLTGVVVAAPNFVTTAQSAITVTVGPAPSSGTDIPTFAATANTAIPLSAFSLCQTTLLFPFVAAGGGFDTGIAISNTGLDPYTAANTAAGTPGSCTFNFYGSGAPTPSTNVSLNALFQSPLMPGATGAFSLAGNSVAPNFVGYVIAQCGFLYGHGFSYITYNNGTPSATAEGYLAIIIGNNRSANVVGQGPEGTVF